MGIIRFIFAASVLIFHANPLFRNNLALTKLAVPSFFVISGFYICLIINKKYIGKNSSYWLYLTNRFLRIYPLYWAVLLLMVAFSLFKYVTGGDNALLRAIGSGVNMFDYLLRNGTLVITSNLWRAVNPDIGYLIGPQVWALQPEILFYIGAPFVLKRRPKIIAALMLTTLIVLYFLLPSMKKIMDGSIFFVFLSSLKYFFLGIVSYFIYRGLGKIKKSPKAFYFIIAFIVAILATAANNSTIEIVYFLSLTGAIPFIFVFFTHDRWDTLLGGLSYPVFISHIFFIKLTTHLIHTKNLALVAGISMIVTVFSSYILLKLIDEPINRLRQKRLT